MVNYDLMAVTAKTEDEAIERLADKNCEKIKFPIFHQLSSEFIIKFSSVLTKNKTLLELDLSYSTLGINGLLAILEALTINTTLISLNISHTVSLENVKRDVIERIASLFKKITTLKRLSFGGLKLLDKKLLLESILSNPSWQALDFHDSNFNEDDADILGEFLLENNELLLLNLNQNHLLKEKGLIALAKGLSKNKTLEYLNLANTISIRGGAAAALAVAIAVHPKLKSISLEYVFNSSYLNEKNEHIFNDYSGIKPIAQALKNNKVIQKVKFANLDENEVALLMDGLCENSSLTHLSLIKGCMGSKGEKGIAKFIRSHKFIRTLNLTNCRLKISKAILSAVKESTSLEELVLSGNEMSQSDAPVISEILKQNKTLVKLDLSCIEDYSTPLQGENTAQAETTKAVIMALYRNNILRDLRVSGGNIFCRRQLLNSFKPFLENNTTLLNSDLAYHNLSESMSSPAFTQRRTTVKVENLKILNEIIQRLKTLSTTDPSVISKEEASLRKEFGSLKVQGNNCLLLIKYATKVSYNERQAIFSYMRQKWENEVAKFEKLLKHFDPVKVRNDQIAKAETKVKKEEHVLPLETKVVNEQVQKVDTKVLKEQGAKDKVQVLKPEAIAMKEKIHQPETKLIKELNNKTEVKQEKEREVALSTILLRFENLEFGPEIGKGGFGIVQRGILRSETESPKTVAIKKLLSSEVSQKAEKEFNKECKMMAELNSADIVKFIGYCPKPHFCMVMEYMPKLSLYNVIKTEKPLEWKIRINIASNIVCGLEYLHAKKIVHRDIKSRNVLLTDDYRAKICDFGLCQIKTDSQSNSSMGNDLTGTFAWMAPELKCSKKADIYSMAIVLWEICAWREPYSTMKKLQPAMIPLKVKGGMRETILQDWPEKFKTLIPICWDTEPKKRPTATSIADFFRSEATDFNTFLNAYHSKKNGLAMKVDASSKTSKKLDYKAL